MAGKLLGNSFVQNVALLFVALGLLALVIGGVWALVQAFRESILWGLGCILFSPVALVFLVLHWAEAKRPFFLQLAGLILLGAPFFLLPELRQNLLPILLGKALPTKLEAAPEKDGGTAKTTIDLAELRSREADLRARKTALDPHDAAGLAQLQADVLKYNSDLRAATGVAVPEGYAAPAAAPTPQPPSKIATQLRGQLVSVQNGTFAPWNEPPDRAARYYAIYFSAHWCPPCRAFTPELVAWYHRTRKTHPHLELIFVSSDRSAADMLGYMKSAAMPWPAVAFDKKQSCGLKSYAGNGIPCLVLIDGEGKVLSHSYVKGKYRGPRAVLSEIAQLVPPISAGSFAARQ